MLEVNHPWYCLCLHNGQDIDTGVMPAGLFPRYAGHFAPVVDNPFKDLRSEGSVKIRLYGIHIDAQLDSLQRVWQAKEFAKANSQMKWRFQCISGTSVWKDSKMQSSVTRRWLGSNYLVCCYF